MFIAHGTADLVTSIDSSIALYEAARSTDKTIRLYEDTWHVIHLEPNFPVCRRIITKLDIRFSTQSFSFLNVFRRKLMQICLIG